MKNNRYQKWLISVIAILLLLLCLAAKITDIIFDPFAEFVYREPHFYEASNIGSYQIDPQTILTSLANNETNIFLPLIKTPDASLEQNPILWQQSDYLKIATAAFDSRWKESQSGWSLNRMIFDTDCRDPSKGFDYAIFNYYKKVWHGMELRYLGRRIEISPQYHEVDWYGDAKYYPSLFSLESSIDLKNVKFDATDAIEIAEKNGGSATRLAVNNKCSIYLILDGIEKRGWDVFYEGDESRVSIFEIYVDPYTGKIHQK